MWWGSNILLSTFPCAAFCFSGYAAAVREVFRRVLKVTVCCPLHKTESVLDKTSCSCLLDMVWNQSWHIAIWFNLLMQLLFHPWEWPEVAIKDNYSVYFFAFVGLWTMLQNWIIARKALFPSSAVVVVVGLHWGRFQVHQMLWVQFIDVRDNIYAHCFWEACIIY